MNEYRFRPATRRDMHQIRSLIRRVRINPFRLHWQNFLVATDSRNRIIACGQLKSHGRRTIELASIAVEKKHRGRGIAASIVERLLKQAPRPVYLVCLPHLAGFYSRFGFQPVNREELPPHFRRVARFSRFVGVLHRSRAPVILRLR